MTSSRNICKECGGWCCQYTIHAIKKNADDFEEAVEFYKVRATGGWHEEEDQIIFVIPQPCPHFNGECKIYKDRPQICRAFPQGWHPQIVRYCKLMRKEYGN